MIGGVELAGLAPVAATPIGAFAGARHQLHRQPPLHLPRRAGVAVRGQPWRYALVSGVSLGLNTAGE